MKFADFKSKVNKEILNLMEEHDSNWIQPYCEKIARFGNPHNAIKGNTYSGMNKFYLSCLADYERPMYATYKQWTSIGGDMSNTKGKGLPVIYFNSSIKKEKNAKGEEKTRSVGFYRVYYVFNIADVGNVDESKLASTKAKATMQDIEPDEKCESIIKATNAGIVFNQERVPCYIPSKDIISMPDRKAFYSSTDYYSTMFHELTHWTGHKSRLNRIVMKERTKKDYAFEELVAEIGSAHLCVASGIEKKPREDHAKYLNSWMTYLKEDDNIMVKAFSKASKATDFILNTGE